MALVQKAFSDIITFSRSSNATRVGPDGLIQYAPHNLLLYSQELDNAAWTKGANVTVTANAAAAPDGTVTADLVVSSASADSSTNQVFQQVTVASSQTYTASFWVRAAGANQNITVRQTANGVLVTNTTVAVTSTWQRVSVTFTASTNPGFAIRPDTVSNLNIYVWGAQLAVGPLALDYTPTTTAAVYGPRFDFDGSGVTSVDPIATNLLLQSGFAGAVAGTPGTPPTSWSLAFNTGSLAAVADYQGIGNSLTFTAEGTRIVVSQSVSVLANATYALSVKVLSSNVQALQTVLFNPLPAGATVTGPYVNNVLRAGSYVPAENETLVYILSVGATAGSATLRLGAGVSSNTTGTVTLVLPQLELGSTATGYMPSGATNGFRAVPVVSGSATPRGLLIEEQRTNLLTYSEMFADASWTKTNATITANTVAAPDGTLTADKLVESSGSSAKHFSQSATLAATTSYTQTVYAKAAGRNFLQITSSTNTSGSGSTYQNYDLVNGTLGGSSGGKTATITAMGNGWYRCSYTDSSISAGTGQFVIAIVDSAVSTRLQAYTGDGTSGIFIWGAQLEAGAFATSYIPTVASTVTRSADVASVNTLSPWFNATEGTLFAEGSTFGNVSGGLISIEDGTANNRMQARANSSAQGAFVVVASASVDVSIVNGSFPASTTGKLAAAYKVNDFALSVNGASATVDTLGNVPTVNRLNIGFGTSQTILNGHLRRIAVYPRRLTNAEIQALTS